jgi:hypothetical protein
MAVAELPSLIDLIVALERSFAQEASAKAGRVNRKARIKALLDRHQPASQAEGGAGHRWARDGQRGMNPVNRHRPGGHRTVNQVLSKIVSPALSG